MIEIAKAPSQVDLRLNLACGKRPVPGFDGVDYVAGDGVKHVLNLNSYPWPWEDDSVAALTCEHYVEHLPPVWYDPDGVTTRIVPTGPADKEAFFQFFDECFRILKPGGHMTVVTPCGRHNRAFQDPTHRRFIVSECFAYLSRDWRVREGLDHYNVNCNFDVKCNAVGAVGEELFAQETIIKRYTHYWNIVQDWKVELTAMKGQKALPKELTGPLQAM